MGYTGEPVTKPPFLTTIMSATYFLSNCLLFGTSMALSYYLTRKTITQCIFTNYTGVVRSLETEFDFDASTDPPVVAQQLSTKREELFLTGDFSGTRYKRVCGHLARCVKAKMGLPKQTEANRLVALELISKELEEMGVRKSERCKFIPLALVLVFIPTEHDLVGRRVGLCAESRRRTKAMHEGLDTVLDKICSMLGFGRGKGVQFPYDG